MDGTGNIPVGEAQIALNHKFPGVQPVGAIAIGLQLGGQDGGGEDFSVGYFFIVRGGEHLLKERIQTLLHAAAFRTGKKTRHNVPVPFPELFHGREVAIGYLQQRVRAAADGRTNQHHTALGCFLAHDVQHPGNIGCGGYRRAAEFQYTIHSYAKVGFFSLSLQSMVQVLGIFGFLSFGWADVLDILMVAAIIFFLIRSIKGDSTVLNIVLVLVVLLVLQAVVSALNMRMMTVLLNTLLDVGVLAIIILFQPEIRHLLNRLAVNSGLAKRTGELFDRLLGIKEEKLGSRSVVELSEAVRAMAAEHTGALIVLQKKNALDEYIATGDRFEAEINRRLVMNIFFKNSPLHDGAMIIQGDRIVAARCQLPMTDRTDIPAHYGMRHRAAIGMTENSDADVVVVSEETGSISFVHAGEIRTVKDLQELRELVGESMTRKEEA